MACTLAAGPGKKLPPTADPNEIGSTNQTEIRVGASGSAVIRAQILLARAHFSCGQVDGSFGTNLEKTVAAFQNERHLPASGAMDSDTWAALNADRAPLLIHYVISDEDQKGPFVQVPKDMMKQAELPHLGYSSPLDELSERFHSSPDLLKSLNPGADFSKAGADLTVPNVLVMPPGGASSATRVVVSKSESSVRAYDGRGKLLAFYVATIGSQHDPLPVGDWKIVGVTHDPVFHYNASLFWDARNPDDHAEIQPGPRNPVGLVWMDLSKQHYGIHGAPDASLIGHAFSHGCIRLTNWDALELASMVKPGTAAVLKE
ncbi:MAG TPA: L,D-transpeptidase [Bryobacteraceae bacterium]|nr:L,D-transpeptidase [Bryobacteraceae bacterium]